MKSTLLKVPKTIAYSSILSFILIITGCASMMTSTAQYKDTKKAMIRRDIPAAIKQIEKKKAKYYKKKDRVIKYLDLGMLYHYQGDYEKSNQLLEKAELAMEELYTKSISKAALSMLLNDNALDYFGEDYEDIYTNVFKALNYLHQDKFDDAFVEIRRLDLKLSQLEDKNSRIADSLNTSQNKKADIKAGTNKYTNSALGSYLSMIIYEHEGRIDDANLDRRKIRTAFNNAPAIYDFSPPPLPDSLIGADEPSLHVVALVGSSPYKREKELHIATGGDMLHIVGVGDEIDYAPIPWSGIDSDYYFKFALPFIINEPSIVSRVLVRIDGQPFELAKLEDIGNVAVHTFKVREPIIYLKSITRAVIKGVAAELAKKEMKEKNPGITGSLMGLATDVAVYATENADLRTSRFFPNAVLVADIPVQPGEHNVSIEYYDSNGYLLYKDDKSLVNINADSFNLIESWNLQ